LITDGEGKDKSSIPLFLEINYYPGREGLGGFSPFYENPKRAGDRWLAALP
jgi:hypothetical protein